MLIDEGHRHPAGPDPGHRRPAGPAAAGVRRLRGRHADRRGHEGRRDLAAGARRPRRWRSCARRGRRRALGARATTPACRPARDRRGASSRSPRSPPGSSASSLPVLAGGFQVARAARSTRERGEEAVRCAAAQRRPRSCSAPSALLRAGLAALDARARSSPSAASPLVRDGERLRIRRGLVQRSEATVPVSRVRAVRVVEGVFRRPFGLAALTVEVTGYADEASAARTLFPLVRAARRRGVPGRVPARAGRRPARPRPPAAAAPRAATSCGRCWPARPFTAGAWFVVGPYALSRSLLAALATATRAGAPPAGACATAAWRSARCCLARTTVLAPARFRESHTLAQNLLPAPRPASPTSRSPSASRPPPASATSSRRPERSAPSASVTSDGGRSR